MRGDISTMEESDSRMTAAKEIVAKFSDYVNNMGHSPQAFAEFLMREHRTLQQSMFGCMVECIRKWAESERTERFDLRNEDTVKICKRLNEVLEKEFNGGYTRFI